MTIIDDRLALLDELDLKAGSHERFDAGACLLEAVAWVSGEPFTDHPACVCPVIAAFGRAWNDGLPDDATRNRLLRPFVPRLVGTASTPDVQDARAFMSADWAVRVFTPAWLRLAGLEENAAELEALKALASVALCQEAMPAVKRARVAARDAAGDAAGAAAWAAARDAAWDAAWVAAGDAARAAAWDAAGVAAGDAARAAARDAARVAAWAAARVAAWDAARVAARDAARAAARDAARVAARDALTPTVEALQSSALDLLERMIAVTPESLAML